MPMHDSNEIVPTLIVGVLLAAASWATLSFAAASAAFGIFRRGANRGRRAR